MSDIERRSLSQPIALDADAPRRISGYGAVYESETVIPGAPGEQPFRECFARGAFDRIEDDIRCLYDHTPGHGVLGRMSAGTLRVTSDDHGLHYSCDVPDTTLGNDVLVSVQRGDLNGSSIQFLVHPDNVEWVAPRAIGELPLRRILRARVVEIGPVVWAAYDAATVVARSATAAAAECAIPPSAPDSVAPVDTPTAVPTAHLAAVEYERFRFLSRQ